MPCTLHWWLDALKSCSVAPWLYGVVPFACLGAVCSGLGPGGWLGLVRGNPWYIVGIYRYGGPPLAANLTTVYSPTSKPDSAQFPSEGRLGYDSVSSDSEGSAFHSFSS